ncbi:MAG: rhodanese-like domain-containing protein [Candidatus Krumholzibacteria bacterium]
MGFLKSLVGGLVIMVIATGLGVLQNSVRSKPLTLFPKVPKKVAQKATSPATTAEDPVPAASAHSETALNEEPGSVATAAPAEAEPITADEYASGELTRERLLALLETGTITLLDARSEHEFEEGHLPGAINIPYDNFVDYYSDLENLVPLDADVITYCKSVTCDLSDNLAQELQLAGYEKVLVYRGGWLEWTEADLPVEGTE